MKMIFPKTIAGIAMFLGIIGCESHYDRTDPTNGTMRTQSGESVRVYRDSDGRDYYYENGAKVFVNVGGPTQTKDRHTTWQEQQQPPRSDSGSSNHPAASGGNGWSNAPDGSDQYWQDLASGKTPPSWGK
jgi:hypothetical protein